MAREPPIFDGPRLNLLSLDPTTRTQGEFAFVFGGKWGFVGETGAVIVEPRFEKVKRFTEGRAAFAVGVRVNDAGVTVDGGKWGFIGKKGEVVIQPQFDTHSCLLTESLL